MARNIIPMKDLPSFTEEIVYEDIPYINKFNWNSRGEFWTIDFYNIEQVALILGLKLVSSYELIAWYPDRDLPPGQLFIIDPNESNVKPSRYSFVNEELYLVYVDRE